ncbi:MAG TPA: hypothetical protein EYN73_08325 [Chromatiaceae bacterium]|jgi:spermidine synthase|nr:hypothetical protein [Chromatiaceae bacterium]HIA09052.1 hypothetical protein [Chromatiaceae bacterium]HIB84593.1 hypothetical protein [Chromatiaceae bacterium]HIN81763.1 hypothetical protein [Chromatiales bacterium]HIO14615.1 hypothetical protein [Chromatiales bacterium]
MAVIWTGDIDGQSVEVRSAGQSRRLYTEGVFHSQYNPRRPLTGSVWDLLMLPAFFHQQTPRRVLVLGVGGGTVIHLIEQFVDPVSITGVELHALHLSIARRHFHLNQTRAQLICADAVEWVQQYRGTPFDLVIEDLYGGVDGEPVRSVAANAGWFKALLRLVSDDGTLVMNFTDREQLQRAAYFTNQSVARRFANSFALTTPGFENQVAAFLRYPSNGQQLRTRLRRQPGLDYQRANCPLNFRIRRLRQVGSG